MRLSDEALQSLRRVLAELGFGKEVEVATNDDVEQLAMFLLNLTAAAVKTRERMREVGRELPPSRLPDAEVVPVQAALPGFD